MSAYNANLKRRTASAITPDLTTPCHTPKSKTRTYNTPPNPKAETDDEDKPFVSPRRKYIKPQERRTVHGDRCNIAY
jgi:hypothetical protein